MKYIIITIIALICLVTISATPNVKPQDCHNVYYVGTLDSAMMHNSKFTKIFVDSSWIYIYGTALNFNYKDSLYIFTADSDFFHKLFITNDDALVAYQILKVEKPTH